MGGRNICLKATVLMIIVLGLIDNSQSVTYLSDYVKISKCCPQSSELIAVTDESGQKSYYQCSETRQDDELHQTFFGYNLEISDESQIPSCENVLLFDIHVDGQLISSDSCIDMYQGVLHGLTCSELFKVEVHKVFKCCAEGFSYDIINRECVESLDVPKDFRKLFSKSVGIFQTNVPDCESDEIFVEYETDIHNTKLIRSGLKLSAIESEILKPGTFCIDGIVNSEWNETTISPDNGIIVRSCRPKDLCAGMPCVRRCCSNDMVYRRLNGTVKCVPYARSMKPTFHDIGSPTNESASAYLEVEPPVYGLINTQACNKYKLSDDPDDAHYISHVDGSLHVNHFEKPFSNDEYCVEFLDTGTVDIHTFVCFSPYPQTKFTYYAIGLTISCIFLALTLICYACLPKLLNLHGKTLVCHVISLLSAYISLAIVQFHTETRLELCYFVAYLIFFCFLAAFCWQSIMCFDIWWTFGSVRTSRGMRRTKEMRRFLLYSLYAWGVPTILTALTVFVDYCHLVPDIWSPQMGAKNMCWFARENWRGHFIFFLFPIGLHILTNAILFILTAIHCNKIKSEINAMQCAKDNDLQDKKRKFLADKAKYTMNLKLFVVMGGTWVMEIVATLLQEVEQWWYISDFFNIFQGVLVFVIFVCKRKVLEAIKQRLGIERKKTKGQTTVTTQLSVTSNGKLGKSASTSTLSTSNTNLNVVRKAA